MEIKKINFFALFFVLLIPLTIESAERTYFTDLTELPPNLQKLYQNARSILNDWSGEYDKLNSAKAMINDFIKIEPNFLPIYIEQSRQIIMFGYTGNNDTVQHNKKALEILKYVQEKDPTYAKSYVLAGHVYTNLDDYKNAQISLTKAADLGSKDPWLYNNWSSLLWKMGQYSKALENSIKALENSNNNAKALISAILDIERISNKLQLDSNKSEIVEHIFRVFKTPASRLRIAERLVSGYNGRRQILNYAHSIISKQKEITPKLVQCDIEMANLILQSGYKSTLFNINQYRKKNMEISESILTPLKGDKIFGKRVFNMLFKIALSEKDFNKAQLLINEASDNGIPSKDTKIMQATLNFALGKFKSVIDIYNELIESDPSLNNSKILISAYHILGDNNILEEYHLKLVNRYPDDAWVMGNYSIFLLFGKHDELSAIKYGERALKLMEYPLARNVTGLAYQVHAAKLFSDNQIKEALEAYKKSIDIGVDEDYTRRKCMSFCETIQKVEQEYRNRFLDSV